MLSRYKLPVAAAIVGGIAVAGWLLFTANGQVTFDDARRAMMDGDYEETLQIAERLLEVKPRSNAVLTLAAQAATRLGRNLEAIDYYSQIPDEGGPAAVNARCEAGELFLKEIKSISAAESQFRRALEQDPDNVLANDRMAYLLGLQSRSWELIPFQLALIRLGAGSPRRLYILSLGDKLHTDSTIVRGFLEKTPDDPRGLLARSSWAIRVDQNYDLGRELLMRVLDAAPSLMEAQVQLGRLLVDVEDEKAFYRWYDNLPIAADNHPGIWVARGSWARNQQQNRTAVRCFWEAVRRNPNNQHALYQLGQTLLSLELNSTAEPFLERSSLLQQYSHSVYVIIAKSYKKAAPADYHRTIELAEKLGLAWEAHAWSVGFTELYPQDARGRRALNRIQPLLGQCPRTARAAESSNPAAKVDLSDYPLPDWSDKSGKGDELLADRTVGQHQARFNNEATLVGLDFSYDNRADPALRHLGRMYEFTGGGVAAIDFDGDWNCDVYFTQGGRLPEESLQSPPFDKLFRNLGDGRFVDVTAASRMREDRYSQGVAVGDFNNDGFADCYVANIGENRLYENNGDGTFSDVSASSNTAGDSWTTSCLIADLNRDGLPDIYSVNYLSGADLLTRVCANSEGRLESCLPQNFPAAQDQLFLNSGDGQFHDVTVDAGIDVPGGKGLGIVAADFDGSQKLSLFVANDGQPNFYFNNQTKQPGATPRFVEQALTRGLSANAEGRLEACMGIAAGDADGDGSLDLFVTNFTEESNTLYLQQPGLLFDDATIRGGLQTPTLNLLGFGTQFVDGELDGDRDLIVTNGHIDNYAPQFQFEMPPQYFENVGNARFVESPPKSLGAYFRERYLGRGLARLDWNRDGLEDLAVSHINAPAALLTNSTKSHGNFSVVRLVATLADRDAIGTTVSIDAAGKTFHRQLTAGDGYQASNQRILTFGLGKATQIDRLKVDWQSGHTHVFEDVPVNRELMIVEATVKARLLYDK